MKTTCIIPAYNEEKNITRVLDIATMYPFNEIILADDGSTDNTLSIIKQYHQTNKKIKILQNKQNQGKTATIINSIKLSKHKLIIILDSDLIHLTQANIDTLITSITTEKYDMTILDRAGDCKAIWGFTNCARFFGGERAFWKKDFLAMNLPKNSGFLLEIILNLHYIKQNKKIKTIYCENLYCVQDFKKRGMLAGIKHYSIMGYQIVRYSNVPKFLQQIYAIEEDLFPRLYSLNRNTKLKPIIIPIIFIASLSSGIWFFLKLNLQSLMVWKKLTEWSNQTNAQISRLIK